MCGDLRFNRLLCGDPKLKRLLFLGLKTLQLPMCGIKDLTYHYIWDQGFNTSLHECITRMSEWSLCGDHVNWFCVRIFHESTWWVKYHYQKQWTWSLQMVTTNLYLCQTTINLMLNLKVLSIIIKNLSEKSNIILGCSNT